MMPGTIPEPQWQLASSSIQSASSCLVVSHIHPDGDAVGTLMGICESLRALGKQVTAVIDGGVPADLAFIPNSDTINGEISSGDFSLMIAVDSSDIERMGNAGVYGIKHSNQVINLDHHATNTCYGDILLVAPHAVAAAEVAFDLLTFMGCELSVEVALALLTGLVTDTQGFRISATSSRTLEIAQALMERGAPLTTIMANTLNRRSYEEVELWKYVLPSMTLEGGLICADITQRDIAQAGLTTMSDGGLVNHLLTVDQATVSIVFRELPEEQVEVSFRSKPGFDVASLAYQLGGGGHKQASGCTVDGSLAEVRAIVMPLARQAVIQGFEHLE